FTVHVVRGGARRADLRRHGAILQEHRPARLSAGVVGPGPDVDAAARKRPLDTAVQPELCRRVTRTQREWLDLFHQATTRPAGVRVVSGSPQWRCVKVCSQLAFARSTHDATQADAISG